MWNGGHSVPCSGRTAEEVTPRRKLGGITGSFGKMGCAQAGLWVVA